MCGEKPSSSSSRRVRLITQKERLSLTDVTTTGRSPDPTLHFFFFWTIFIPGQHKVQDRSRHIAVFVRYAQNLALCSSTYTNTVVLETSHTLLTTSH